MVDGFRTDLVVLLGQQFGGDCVARSDAVRQRPGATYEQLRRRCFMWQCNFVLHIAFMHQEAIFAMPPSEVEIN